jgi:hypothetical protein
VGFCELPNFTRGPLGLSQSRELLISSLIKAINKFRKHDPQGEEYLRHWLTGNGAPFERLEDPRWSAYMKASDALRSAAMEAIRTWVVSNRERLQKDRKVRMDIKTSAVIGLGDGAHNTGYYYLNGSHDDGDGADGFQIAGDVFLSPDDSFLTGSLTFTFHDRADPNFFPDFNAGWEEFWDSSKVAIADSVSWGVGQVVALGAARDFTTTISWSESNFKHELKTHKASGWPWNLR